MKFKVCINLSSWSNISSLFTLFYMYISLLFWFYAYIKCYSNGSCCKINYLKTQCLITTLFSSKLYRSELKESGQDCIGLLSVVNGSAMWRFALAGLSRWFILNWQFNQTIKQSAYIWSLQDLKIFLLLTP